MDVVFVIGGGHLYGSNRCLLSLLGGLEKADLDAGIISIRRGCLEERIEAQGHRVQVIPKRARQIEGSRLQRGLSVAEFIRKTRKQLDTWSPDLVYVNGGQTAGMIAAGLSKAPVLHHAHSLPTAGPLEPVRYQLWTRIPDKTIAVSRFVEAQLKTRGKTDHSIAVVHNGYPQDEPQPGTREARSHLGLPQDSVIVGVASRLVPEKGIAEIVEAFARVGAEVGRRIDLAIAGGDLESEYADRIRRTVRDVGIQEHVEMLGFVEEIGQFYASIDILVNAPQYAEPFGLTSIEAMAHGIPVVAPSDGAGPEIVEDGETGYLFDRSTPGDLPSKLLHLVQDDEVRGSMGTRGRKRFEAHFDVERYVDDVLSGISPYLGG